MPLSRQQTTAEVTRIMLRFAERTGLNSELPVRRYLWTDAFAVCNFLALSSVTFDEGFNETAPRLVEQVHHVLGRFRPDDARRGWLSGLAEADGEAHPTRGGLRIGKQLPERRSDDQWDPDLEWERDGQYFHYLTKWMHALDQVARATEQSRYNLWARELALSAHAGFTRGTAGTPARRMVWKMSTDLRRPLVSSMGHHDPLDGFVTYTQLQTTAKLLSDAPSEPDLSDAIADFSAMLDRRELTTSDPLGLGGLLMDAGRVAQLETQGASFEPNLLEDLLSAALAGLEYEATQNDLQKPASQRLAFRELGLAIGLSAIPIAKKELWANARRLSESAKIRELLEALSRYIALRSDIESFWLDSENQRARTWSEHLDINEVMLATCLMPEGCLVLRAS